MSMEGVQGPSWSKNWRGNYHTWMRTYTKEYDFPVTTYKIGPNGERIKVETADR